MLQAGGITLLAAGIYTSKFGIGVAARYVENRLGKPSLIRDTSRLSPLQIARHPVQVHTFNALLCLGTVF